MNHSLSRTETLDVGRIGILEHDLPPWQNGPIDLKAWFFPDTAEQPLELEIGSGKGTFLVQQASQLPGVNYVGIENANSFWRHAADRCRRHGLENVRLIRSDATFFVPYYVPDECLQQVHIYFPDPWPKKRHHKRRLINDSFLQQLHAKLAMRGLVRVATDHADYNNWITDHVSRLNDLFDRLPFSSPESASQGELVGTNFERKYRRMGRSFYGLILRKR